MLTRRFTAVLASLAVVASGLALAAPSASAAVTNASITPSVWQPSEQAQTVISFDSSTASTGTSGDLMSVEVGWGWIYQHANPSTTPQQYTASHSGTTYTCATIGVTFQSAGFASAPVTPASVVCEVLASSSYVGNPGQLVRLKNIGADGFTFSQPNTVTVTFDAGTITAPSSAPASDTWRIIDVGAGSGVTVTTTVPAVDAEGNALRIITISFGANGGLCAVSQISGYEGTWATVPTEKECIRSGYVLTGFSTQPDGSGFSFSPGGAILLNFEYPLYAIYGAPRAPGAPTDVVAIAGRNQVTVSWKAPADPGSSSISNYLAQASPSGRSCVTRLTDADMLTCTFDLPATNTKYSFTVQALNSAGWGENSSASAAVSPFDLVLLKAERPRSNFFQRLFGWGSTISMSGRAPGYAPGTSVTPEWKAGNGNWVTERRAGVKVGSNSQISWSKKIKKNLNGDPITVRFVIGAVASDEGTLRIGSTVGLPAAPRNVKVSYGDARTQVNRNVKVSWQAPSNDGGSPITSYQITLQVRQGSLPVTCTVPVNKPLTCTLNTGVLERKKKYTVYVTATSARGQSKPAKAEFRG